MNVQLATSSWSGKSKLAKWSAGLAAVMVLIIGGVLVSREAKSSLPDGLLQANGRIEGDTVTISSKFPGRIAKLHAREGAVVQCGEVLVELDNEQAEAKVNQAQQAVRAIQAQLKAAHTGLEVLRKQVPLEIATAEAALTQAQATETQADRDASRFRDLAASGTVDQRKSEQQELASAVAQAALRSAEQHLAQARLGPDRVQAREDEVTAMAAQLAQAKATLAEAVSVERDLVLKAPASGVVTTRTRDVGEVVAAGTPILTTVNLDKLYLQVYVPGAQIGKLHRDLPARIYTDALPDQIFPASVRYIASRAEFTPKEVQTPDERVKLVYAVRLYLDANPDHRLTPGLPADAIIRWKTETPWAKPRW
jgi:HlyD family secretion protein